MPVYSSYLFINLGVPELSIIFVLVLLLFGPGKLPGVMKSLGDGVRQFKNAATGLTGESNEKLAEKSESSSDKAE